MFIIMGNKTVAIEDIPLIALINILCPNASTSKDVKDCLNLYDILPEIAPIVQPLSTGATVFLVVCYAIVFVLALIGNSLVVIVIMRRRCMRTVINMFILSLAVSDLLIVVFCIPFTLVETITIDWVLGSFMCRALNYIAMVAIVVSTLTLLVIAVERHHAICYPLRARMIKNPRRAGWLVALLWGISMCLVSPLLFVLKVIEHTDSISDVIQLRSYKFCQEQWRSQQDKNHFTLFLVVFLYIIPLITMIILYLRVANQLWVRKAVAPGDIPRSKASNACSLRYKKRATKMLITVVVLFAICWLPYHIVSLIRDFTQLIDTGPNRLMLAIVQLIGFSNSFNNPVVYVFLNENFKRNFLRTLTVVRRNKRTRGKKSSSGAFPPYNVATTL